MDERVVSEPLAIVAIISEDGDKVKVTINIPEESPGYPEEKEKESRNRKTLAKLEKLGEEEDSTVCSICLDEFTEEDPAVKTVCQVRFCFSTRAFLIVAFLGLISLTQLALSSSCYVHVLFLSFDDPLPLSPWIYIPTQTVLLLLIIYENFDLQHGYHLQCIMQWAQRSRECPLCFMSLKLNVSIGITLFAPALSCIFCWTFVTYEY